MPGVGEAADADLAADAAGKEASTGARSVFRAGEGALRRDAASEGGAARQLFAKNASTSTLLRQGGMSAVKSYGKAAVKQAGRNLYKGAIIPAIDVGILEAGGAMYKGKGDDGPSSPPPNPLLGVQQTYASYATTANALNPYT